MANGFFDPAILVGYASSFFAILIALYNFYKARESAKLKLSPLIEIGIMKMDNLLFYLPLILNNVGSRPAYLEWIDLDFEDISTKEHFPFYVTKNVEGRTMNEIKSILPLFPVTILGHGTSSLVIEFTQGKKKEIQVERNYQAVLTFHYNGDKKLIKKIPFEFKSSFADLESGFSPIRWNSLQQRIQDPSDYPGITLFGQDMKR